MKHIAPLKHYRALSKPPLVTPLRCPDTDSSKNCPAHSVTRQADNFENAERKSLACTRHPSQFRDLHHPSSLKAELCSPQACVLILNESAQSLCNCSIQQFASRIYDSAGRDRCCLVQRPPSLLPRPQLLVSVGLCRARNRFQALCTSLLKELVAEPGRCKQ